MRLAIYIGIWGVSENGESGYRNFYPYVLQWERYGEEGGSGLLDHGFQAE
jgi:hypothetical protein